MATMQRLATAQAVHREELEYDGRIWYRYPGSENRSDRVYYRTGVDVPTYEYLHRYIWEQHHGPIPEGYAVHHRDGDPDNNDIVNLECVPFSEHMRWHGANQTEEQLEQKRQHAADIRPLASEWHRSPEGRKWHRKNGKAAWAKREPITLKCQHCGEEFETLARHGHTKFCSNNCKSAARKASGVDDETRTCARCGRPFVVNKYAMRKYCSRSCSSRAAVVGGAD